MCFRFMSRWLCFRWGGERWVRGGSCPWCTPASSCSYLARWPTRPPSACFAGTRPKDYGNARCLQISYAIACAGSLQFRFGTFAAARPGCLQSVHHSFSVFPSTRISPHPCVGTAHKLASVFPSRTVWSFVDSRFWSQTPFFQWPVSLAGRLAPLLIHLFLLVVALSLVDGLFLLQ